MEEAEIRLVERSFAAIRPIQTMAGEIFYARLFTIAPELEEMFSTEPREQAGKLMATLAAVVDGLRSFDALRPAVEDLAARHVTYGVTPRHYEPVGQALMHTLKIGLEDGFTPEVEGAWAKAYALVSDTMVASAYPRAGAVAAE